MVVVVVVLPGLVVPFVDGTVVPVVLCPLPLLAPPFPAWFVLPVLPRLPVELLSLSACSAASYLLLRFFRGFFHFAKQCLRLRFRLRLRRLYGAGEGTLCGDGILLEERCRHHAGNQYHQQNHRCQHRGYLLAVDTLLAMFCAGFQIGGTGLCRGTGGHALQTVVRLLRHGRPAMRTVLLYHFSYYSFPFRTVRHRSHILYIVV